MTTNIETDQAGDVGTLAKLKATEDPRTIEEMIEDDTSADFTIEDAKPYPDGSGWWSVTFDNGTGTGLKMPEGKEIRIGDKLTLYPGGFLGMTRHGFAINDELIQWKTPWERFAERIEWLADYDRKKRERFAEERAELDRKYEALPDPLKARIDRFRAESASFRVDSESYEMAAIWDAPKIQKALQPEVDAGGDPIEVVNAFKDLTYEEQMAKVPDLSEGHSGNTFGGACMLAYRLLAGLEC